MSFLLYGASGYTGSLITRRAVAQGLRPTLAGRSESKVKALAQKYGLDYVVFGLENPAEVEAVLQRFPLVLHCAGPFSKTARPMAEGCLQTRTHYLDITGEIEVFELLKSYHEKALEQQVLLLPGVGFDVVPTDCMAAYLHTRLPDATHLELAFRSVGGSVSHGTLSTMIESLGKSGAVREHGRIVPRPIAHKSKWVNFGNGKRFTASIPWGDVSTAYHSTGIPNITVYTAMPRAAYYLMKLQFLFNPLLRTSFAKRVAQRYADNKVTGPTDSQNERGKSIVWGRVRNGNGGSAEARIEGPESYSLTADMALHLVQQVLSAAAPAGYHTPSSLFGHRLILGIPGTKLMG